MKKINLVTIYLLFFGLVFFLPLFFAIFDSLTEAGLNPFDYARITELDYSAKLNDDLGNGGNLNVTEKITFDIHSAFRSNPFWELWRDLCEDEVDGLKVSYSVNSVTQILPDGRQIPYAESSKLYYYDSDYTSSYYGPYKWYHSPGPYDEYYDLYECVFFYVNGIYREKVQFVINYDMYNAALRYGDCSELYVSMFSENSVNHLEKFDAEILIPNKDMPKEGNYYVNTYGTKNRSFAYTEDPNINPGYHTFSMSLDKEDLKFDPATEYLEFDLVSYGDDYNKFTAYAPSNYYSDEPVLEELKDEHEEYINEGKSIEVAKVCLLLLSLFFSYIIVKKLLKADDKIESKYTFYKPSMEMDMFREIPSNLDPSFAADLAFIKDKKIKDKQDIFAALLLSLVRKEYIEVERIDPSKDWINSNVKLKVLYRPKPVFTTSTYSTEYGSSTYGVTEAIVPEPIIPEIPEEPEKEYEPLTETEKIYFNVIVRHSICGMTTMKDLEDNISIDYAYTDSFVRGLENSTINIGVAQKYFQKANYKQAYNSLKGEGFCYYLLGFLTLTLGNYFIYQAGLGLAFGALFVLGISLIFGGHRLTNLAHNYILLTQFGEDEYVKWHGLYKFLDSDTLMNERSVPDLALWEHYLVYATAFGISDKVIKALEINAPEFAERSQILSNPYYRSRSFYVSSRSFRSSARSTSSFARSGGYGGYGGGGRGGGGGGGGH